MSATSEAFTRPSARTTLRRRPQPSLSGRTCCENSDKSAHLSLSPPYLRMPTRPVVDSETPTMQKLEGYAAGDEGEKKVCGDGRGARQGLAKKGKRLCF
eukprot:2449183-Rhodomonas_salina.6